MQSSTMRVSVIIPTYNYGHFLPDCLESVLGQTVLPDEIVIVDDGSTDNTPEIVQPYLSNPCIKYIRTENSGVSAARNTAINASSGEIIGILDADDKWRADKLELQLPLFEKPKVGVVYSLSQPFDKNGPVTEYRRVSPRRGQVLDALMTNNVVPLSSALVRRECFEIAGMFNNSYGICADFDLWTRMSVRGIEFDYVNQPLMMYRIGHGSMITNVSWKNREQHAILRELFDVFGRRACTVGMKRTAWASYFSKRAYSHYTQGSQLRSLVDSIRSIYYRPVGVLDGMAWRVLAKSLLPKRVVAMIRRRHNDDERSLLRSERS
jgi:glycosyltransferase involved in cell wall biosynthesis